MSTLLPHRKEGAFRRMLVRLETLPQPARDEYLAALSVQDPGWAALLKTKALTVERVFSWERQTLASVLMELHPTTLAALVTLLGAKVDLAIETLPLVLRERLQESLKLITPTDADRESAAIQLFTHVRKLESEGRLKLEEIDPVSAAPEARAA